MSRVMINACYSLLRKKRREIPVEALPEPGDLPEEDALMLKDALVNEEIQVTRQHHMQYQNGDLLYTLSLPAQGDKPSWPTACG